MPGKIHQSPRGKAWTLANAQHGVVARRQLLELGISSQGIERRVANGRLHPVMAGVYAVGRPELTRQGRWMAAVLACGPGAALSHGSAAALWGIGAEADGCVEISVRASSPRRRRGIHAHRRPSLRASDVVVREGIPVTSPTRTLIDLATNLNRAALERAVNEADKRDLTTPEKLRSALEVYVGEAGVARLRTLLDRRTFRLSDSKLELLFRPLARDAGLPTPLTKQHVNGFEVDFYWPSLGLVVETDGLRYHRTPAAQARDRLRDQTHIAAGLTPLRFTHEQVRFESEYVRATLATIVRRLEKANR
jgi:very-short-patch-repair endonuclease